MAEEKPLSVKERLIALETLTTERWDTHDKRSAEKWGQVSKSLEGIEIYIRAETERRKDCMKEAKDHAEKHTNKVVSLALGIPATICGIIGAFVMVHKMLAR